MSNVALRKTKNAEAQAAFRQRRANYIATLEETVTSLESVVLQLQDSCRDAQSEVTELRQDNDRLRLELLQCQTLWKALWQAQKTPHGRAINEQMPPLPTFPSLPSQVASIDTRIGSSDMKAYNFDTLHRASNSPSTTMYYNNNGSYSNHSTDVAFLGRKEQKISLMNTTLPPFHFMSHEQHHTNRVENPVVTLYGDTADISITGPSSDVVRVGARRAQSEQENTTVPVLPLLSDDISSRNQWGSHKAGSAPFSSDRPCLPRSTASSLTPRSSSPRPSGSPISETLKVIKSQAFGGRARTKKSSKVAAKVAVDVLEARGIGMGLGKGSKHLRLQTDDGDVK